MEQIKNTTVPMLLTDKEKKKLKRIWKQEKIKEKNEKVALGLIPPPPPKLRLSTFMNTVSAQAVADPTKIEQEVWK